MLDLRAYGMKIALNTTSPGSVDWIGDQVLYKGLQFTIADLRSMVHGLVTETRRLLIEELLFCDSNTDCPRIPWSALTDNPAEGQASWNFLQDQRCQWPVQGQQWLFDLISQKRQLQQKFISSRAPYQVKQRGYRAYMAYITEFREKLLVLMHLTGGQPARAPEILSIRHSNTARGGHRNVFVEDGMALFVTRYHKGYSISGDVKIIHRYLPLEVGELLVYYLWLVLPFQQQLETVFSTPSAVSFHMWPTDLSGKKWSSERMRKVMQRESLTGLGQQLGIQSYRDIAIAISRKYLTKKQAFHPDEDDEDGEWDEDMDAATADEQAGHTSHIAGIVYARGIMEGNGVIASKRQRFRRASIAWHRFLGFPPSQHEDITVGRKRGRPAEPFEAEAEQQRMQRWKRLRTVQVQEELHRLYGPNAHFRGVQEGAIQAVMAGESPVVAVMPTGGGKSLLFMLPASIEGSHGGTTIVVVPLIALREDMKQRCEKMGIQCMEWSSRRPGDGATVVLVTPEAAVSKTFATFLNRLKAMRQLDRIVIDECHIILPQQQKSHFRKELQQLGVLMKAESQMVLLTATLPPHMEGELWQRMGWQAEEVKMFRDCTSRRNIQYCVVEMGLPGPGTSQGHGRGSRDRWGGETQEGWTAQWLQQQHQAIGGILGKMVVYCNTVEKVKRLAAALGCPAYHHHQPGKSSLLAEIVQGQHPVVIATSAFGLGIDIADIRLVVHADPPRSMLGYAQESGRAGRDGQYSQAVILVKPDSYRGVPEQDVGRVTMQRTQDVDDPLVAQYIWGGEDGQECRRVVIDQYLDGQYRAGCQAGEEACDICNRRRGQPSLDVYSPETAGWEGSNTTSTPGQPAFLTLQEAAEFWRQQHERRRPMQRHLQQARQLGQDMEELVRQLQKWKSQCAACLAVGQLGDDHLSNNCYRPEGARIKQACQKLRAHIHFAGASGCFWCGVPRSLCDRWELPEQGGKWQQSGIRQCQYQDVMIATLVGIRMAIPEQVPERVMLQPEGNALVLQPEQQWGQYLGQKQAGNGLESNNLIWEFLQTTQQVTLPA